MRQSEVVFMYAPKTPDLYNAYGATAVLWGGGSEAAREARARGVHFQGSIWFLTAWGDRLAEDSAMLRSVCVDVEGKPIEVPWLTDHKQKLPNYWGCTNAPYYRAYLIRNALEAVRADVAGLHIDDHCGTAACSAYAGGCFCEHCRAGFREYLRQHYTAAQLATLGVHDVDSFDYLTYARGFAKTRQEYLERRHSLPLYMPFMNFQVRAQSALVGQVRAECERAVGRPLTLSANCGLPSPLHLGDYAHLDILCGEIGLDASQGKPSPSAHLAYKVADAVRRPLAATASGWDWAWIAENSKPGLVRTWVAESYAFGHRLMAPHHQWAYTAAKGTHWWDGKTEDLAPLYRYIADHRELFDGFEPLSDVVLVYNTPAAYRGQDRAAEVAAYLASNNVQYRVAIAGGDWIDERLSRRDLRAARRVLVTTRDHLDARQAAALSAAAQGGKLIAWDGPASCEGKLPASVVVSGARDVWALVRANPKTGEATIHLLNRDYDLDADGVRPTGHLRITVSGPLLRRLKFRTAVLHSVPEAISVTVPVDSNSRRTVVEVPRVDLWGIVQLTP